MTVPPIVMVIGGGTLLTLLLLQVAIGKRWIKLGRDHLKYHRWIAYAMLAAAVGHAVAGLFVLGYIGV